MQDWSEEPKAKKRRLCQYHGPEPSVEEIEAEFWRIVETPDEVWIIHHSSPCPKPCLTGGMMFLQEPEHL